ADDDSGESIGKMDAEKIAKARRSDPRPGCAAVGCAHNGAVLPDNQARGRREEIDTAQVAADAAVLGGPVVAAVAGMDNETGVAGNPAEIFVGKVGGEEVEPGAAVDRSPALPGVGGFIEITVAAHYETL